MFIVSILILRYPCNVPPMPNNQWWAESNPVIPPLPSAPAPALVSAPVPASTPASKLDSDAQSKLDLDTRIEMLLNGMSSQQSVITLASRSSIECPIKEEDTDISDIVEDTIDDISVTLFVPPIVNDNHSDLDEEKVSIEEETLPPLSNPPSPFLSKDIYIKCFETATEQLKITREKEKIEAKSFLNNTIRNGKFIIN